MWARGPLLSVLVFVSARLLFTASAPRNARKTCDVSGKTFGEGDRLKTADPCLECQCSGGRVDCRLRVCPKLPRPPPPQCYLLERPQSCCASLLCPLGGLTEQARSHVSPKLESELQDGCVLNGTIYGEGSAMVTSSLCEYCYCIRGKQHCVRPKCLLTVPGCKPEYAKHSCCPIKYVCSEINTTVNATVTTSTPSSKSGACVVEGDSYPEGERLTKLEKPCQICYCVKEKPLCHPVICDALPPPNCSPVLSSDQCCPLSYNCSSTQEEVTTAVTAVAELESKEIQIMEHTTIIEPTSTTMATTTFNTEAETTTSEISESTIRLNNETEERFAGSGIESDEGTTTPIPYETTTNFLLEVRNGSGKVRVTSDVIEAIINRTLEKDADYEYDYNEPSLPPSLPNLKIIPFVAADAVLHKNEEDPLYADSHLKTPIYSDNLKTTEAIYDSPITNMFSPPVETEGGFVPKDPSLDDPFFISGIKPDHILPPITESAKIIEGESPKINSLIRDAVTPTNYVAESLSNLPAITVADVVVTPNPFKDVIRTEPPPHLDDIMKDKPIHSIFNTASSNKSISELKSNFTTQIPEIKTSTNTATTITLKEPNVTKNNIKDYDYGENLSFGSVLEFLFSGSSTEKSTTHSSKNKEKPHSNLSDYNQEQSYAPSNNVINHQEAEDRNDFNVSDPADDLSTLNNVFTPEKDQLSDPSTHKALPDSSLSGLLKLAGCNIYGRMYRVGKIIDELSTSCLECLCTELGVQCRKLGC